MHVAVTAIAATAELDAIRDGLIDARHVPGRSLLQDIADARGDPARAAIIAENFAAQAPDAIVAISTPSAAAMAGIDVPPVRIAIDEALHDQARGNAVPLTEAPPVEDQPALSLAVAPEARTIAVPFDPAIGGGAHAAHFAVTTPSPRLPQVATPCPCPSPRRTVRTGGAHPPRRRPVPADRPDGRADGGRGGLRAESAAGDRRRRRDGAGVRRLAARSRHGTAEAATASDHPCVSRRRSRGQGMRR